MFRAVIFWKFTWFTSQASSLRLHYTKNYIHWIVKRIRGHNIFSQNCELYVTHWKYFFVIVYLLVDIKSMRRSLNSLATTVHPLHQADTQLRRHTPHRAQRSAGTHFVPCFCMASFSASFSSSAWSVLVWWESECWLFSLDGLRLPRGLSLFSLDSCWIRPPG